LICIKCFVGEGANHPELYSFWATGSIIGA